MKFYLSSYKFGDRSEELLKLLPKTAKIAHVNNARDWKGADPERATKHQTSEIDFLNSLGFDAFALDLKEYFGKEEELRDMLEQLNGLWVSGGNTFVLRMAMKLSGFDKVLSDLEKRKDFLYAGYSAGVCVLSTSLRPIQNVDDPFNFPFEEIQEAIFDGLGVIDYMILCHYDSNHPESEEVGKEVEHCIENKWLFKVLRDGEVIVIE